jgi:hypothetical protein
MDVTNAISAAVPVLRTETNRAAPAPTPTSIPTPVPTPGVGVAAGPSPTLASQQAVDQAAAALLRAELQQADTRLQLEVDQGAGRVIGRIVNAQTGKVVNQIPSEAMVRYFAKMRQYLGTLFDKKA